LLVSLARKTIWADVETRRRIQADRVNVTPANLYSDISLVTGIKASFELESGKPAPYLVGGLFEDAVIQDFVGAYRVMAWILVRRNKEIPRPPLGLLGKSGLLIQRCNGVRNILWTEAVPAPGLPSGQS
jgi:hypothetical protein